SNGRTSSSSRVASANRSIVASLPTWLGCRPVGTSLIVASPREAPPNGGPLGGPYLDVAADAPAARVPVTRGTGAGSPVRLRRTAQVARLEEVRSRRELGRGTGEHEVAVVEHVAAIGQLQ